MKILHFVINDYEEDLFFPVIRTKIDIIHVLIEAVRLMLVRPPVGPRAVGSLSMVLCVDKMSRLFFNGPKKVYSFSLPFSVVVDDDLVFEMLDFGQVNNKVLAFVKDALGLLDHQKHDDFLFSLDDQVSDYGDEDVQRIWVLIKELMTYEDGYFRYDDDEVSAIDKGEHIHPRHHFDIFYSTRSTFKIGLRRDASMNSIIDMMMPETNCRFLEG